MFISLFCNVNTTASINRIMKGMREILIFCIYECTIWNIDTQGSQIGVSGLNKLCPRHNFWPPWVEFPCLACQLYKCNILWGFF